MRFWPGLLLIIPLLFQGCASTGSNSSSNQDYLRDRITHTALQQLGKPYKYGSASPSSGFDCSGLVYYSHKKAGVSVPRDTRGQIAKMTDVRRTQLQPGDLLFYKIKGNPRHVGIYIGNRQFVHAPSSGKRVKIENMNADYWRSRLYATGSYISH